MGEIFNAVASILTNGVFYYAIALIAVYVVLLIFSGLEIKRYILQNKEVKYRDMLASPHVPSVSLLVPFYNESAIILEKVRSLLSLHYHDFELIVINDGSTDNSLKKLINYFGLQRTSLAVQEQIATAAVKGVYRSVHPAFSCLTVIDKIKGGRCDALNAGINASGKGLVLSLNVNCVLEQDALLKMAKPFMEGGPMVIAAGAVVRSINTRESKSPSARLSVPHGINPKFQVLRHLRSSLLRHMALSRVNSLLHVSRAMAMFHKDTLIKCGGYMPDCVENNVELVIRMKRYMIDNSVAHRVILVPDPICWLPPPASFSAAAGQLKNSFKGTADGLRPHYRSLFQAPYRKLALSCVVLFFSKLVAPVVELGFFILLSIFAALGYVSWQPLFAIALMIYLCSVSFSMLALLYEELTYRYTFNFSLPKLFAACLAEPIIYYPLSLFWFFGSRKANIVQHAGKPLHVAVDTAEPQVRTVAAPVRSIGADKFANCEIRSLTSRGIEVFDE